MRLNICILVSSLTMVAAPLAAAPKQPQVCGVKLGSPTSEARKRLRLVEVGPQPYVYDGATHTGTRWEGKPRNDTFCKEVRAAPVSEPSVVVFATSGSPSEVRGIAHRTQQTDCKASEGEITSRLGIPAISQAEVVEWHPAPAYIVLLTRYEGDDCWLSYISARPSGRK